MRRFDFSRHAFHSIFTLILKFRCLPKVEAVKRLLSLLARFPLLTFISD